MICNEKFRKLPWSKRASICVASNEGFVRLGFNASGLEMDKLVDQKLKKYMYWSVLTQLYDIETVFFGFEILMKYRRLAKAKAGDFMN